MLESLGFVVTQANDAASALEALDARAFDVMLTDVVMPGGVTGLQLARQCVERWPAMASVLASGYAGEDMDEAVAAAPWPFIRKPYSRETLAEALTSEPVT